MPSSDMLQCTKLSRFVVHFYKIIMIFTANRHIFNALDNVRNNINVIMEVYLKSVKFPISWRGPLKSNPKSLEIRFSITANAVYMFLLVQTHFRLTKSRLKLCLCRVINIRISEKFTLSLLLWTNNMPWISFQSRESPNIELSNKMIPVCVYSAGAVSTCNRMRLNDSFICLMCHDNQPMH